jgi:hypothetical protein
MTEEQKTSNEVPVEEEHRQNEIFDELSTLGQELASAFRAMWDHEDSRKVRSELQAGFTELGRQVDEAVKTAQESDAAKQFSESIKETVDRARESDVTAKVEEGVVTGLREVNRAMSGFVSSLQSSGEAGAEAESAPEPEASQEPETEA